MRRVLLLAYLSAFLTFCSNTYINAQSCVPTNLNNEVFNIYCGATCTNVNFQIPHLKSTSTYTLTTIPYTPFQYIVAAGGTEDALLYQDDWYSHTFQLPFSFCFYDSVFSKAVIGSNGLITFDTTNANTANSYPITSPIPYAGGTQGSANPAYYPKSSIMAAFSDIWPTVANSLPDFKIQWRVEGTAPCRKFIISYYHVGTYGNDPCTFGTPPAIPASPNTFQMVLYESTGLIDVYIENKSCTPSTNGGNAILGIQNWNRDQAVAAPGKNGTNWTSSNEGYRFIPSGSTSRFVSSELLTLGGTFIALADTSTTTAGLLDVSFPNICPATNSTQYVVRTTFGSCPTGTNMVSLDTITIIRNPFLVVTAIPTQTACGTNTGTITATANAGVAPFTFTLTGPGGPYAPQVSATNSTVFSNLPIGTFTVTVVDGGGCNGSKDTTVTNVPSLTATVVPTAVSCPGMNNGSLVITPDLGAAAGPYTFTLTGPGGPYTQVAVVSTATFAGLTTGTYSVTFLNGTGCAGAVNNMIVGPGVIPAATITKANTSCSGANDGTVTLTLNVATAGAGPYTVTLNPVGTVQTGVSSPVVFTGLPTGSYTATFTNAAGCIGTTTSVTISNGTTPTATIDGTNISCPGANDGTITITPSGGAAQGPYTITINPGGIVQTGVVAVAVFTNLPPAIYTATFTNAGGCSGTTTGLSISNGPGVSGTAVATATSCASVNDGTILVTPGGIGPYVYTLNPGAVVQNNNPLFTGLAPNTYTITFTTGSGCGGTVSPNPVIASGPAVTGTAIATATTCPAVNDGTITVTPGGTGPYIYTLNPGAIVQNNNPVFTGLAPNTYTITFTTGSGCAGTVSPNPVVTTGPAVTGTAVPTATTCPAINDGTITVTPGGTGPYIYTLNPGAIVQNNNPVFTGLAPNTYTITFTTGSGCAGTVSPNPVVTTGPAVTGTAVATATSCPTVNNGTILVTPGGTGPYIYTLNPGAIVQNNNPLFTGLAPNTYTITFITGSGCGGTVTPNPVVAAGPFLPSTFTPFNPPCSNINNGTITIVPGGVAPYTFVLTGPGGPYNQPAAVFNNLAPGTYNYSFTDGNGCTGTGGPVILTTNSPLAIAITLTQPLCNGNANGAITLAASGGVSAYQYALSPFTTYQPTGVFNGLIAGTYTFRVRDNVGCTKDTIVTLGEPTLLTASATSPTTASCSGNDGTIVVTGFNGTPAYSYSIDNGANYQASNSFIAPAVGPYPAIKVRDANGCVATASTTVQLVDAMFLTLGPDTTVCLGSSITFQPQTNAGTSIYNWRPLDPAVTLPGTIDNPLIRNATVTPTDNATYILNAKWGACSREDTISISILQKPVVHTIGGDTAICQNTYAILHGEATNLSGPVTYSWSPAATVQNPNSPVTIATPASTQTYKLTVTDNYGCNFSVSDLLLVTVQPPVPAFAGNDTIAIKGVPHQLSGSGGADYLWTPAAPLDFSTSQNPLATLYNDQLFILKVTDIAGCIGYDTVFIQVYDGPNYYVPNAFSPNGDGVNDIFRPIPVGITKTDYFRVFNRYGQLVFETNQWLRGWDGRFKGKLQPLGVYVWVIKGVDKNGKIMEMKGTVMLVQ